MASWFLCKGGRVLVYTEEDEVGEENGPYVLG